MIYIYAIKNCAKPFVTNLTKRLITDVQILFLNKGLSFVPTPKDANNFELLRDFDQFCNKISKMQTYTQT